MSFWSSSKVKHQEPVDPGSLPSFYVTESDETWGTGQLMVTLRRKDVASFWVYFWMI